MLRIVYGTVGRLVKKCCAAKRKHPPTSAAGSPESAAVSMHLVRWPTATNIYGSPDDQREKGPSMSKPIRSNRTWDRELGRARGCSEIEPDGGGRPSMLKTRVYKSVQQLPHCDKGVVRTTDIS